MLWALEQWTSSSVRDCGLREMVLPAMTPWAEDLSFLPCAQSTNPYHQHWTDVHLGHAPHRGGSHQGVNTHRFLRGHGSHDLVTPKTKVLHCALSPVGGEQWWEPVHLHSSP